MFPLHVLLVLSANTVNAKTKEITVADACDSITYSYDGSLFQPDQAAFMVTLVTRMDVVYEVGGPWLMTEIERCDASGPYTGACVACSNLTLKQKLSKEHPECSKVSSILRESWFLTNAEVNLSMNRAILEKARAVSPPSEIQLLYSDKVAEVTADVWTQEHALGYLRSRDVKQLHLFDEQEPKTCSAEIAGVATASSEEVMWKALKFAWHNCAFSALHPGVDLQRLCGPSSATERGQLHTCINDEYIDRSYPDQALHQFRTKYLKLVRSKNIGCD
ncbi:MAG: hypothetical protein WC654_02295 [Patescibacteria group bacterium]